MKVNLQHKYYKRRSTMIKDDYYIKILGRISL